MSKCGTFGDYPSDSLASAEKVLLTAWRSLERYHDDLVLVGGLAVHYLTKSTVVAFHAEANAANTGFEFAVKSLQHDFINAGQDGPIRAAEFHPGNAGNRDRVREDVATVGRMLLGI